MLMSNVGPGSIEPAHGCFCAAYPIDDLDALKHSLRDFIFSYYFPNTMIRGIQRITEELVDAGELALF